MKNRLMQLFRANAGAPQVRVHASEDGTEATLYLYDAIGGWFGILAEEFVKELNALDADTIHLRINSPGGDVFEARAIATAIRAHKAKVVAHIDGLAASAATYISAAADEVRIAKGAFYMIHNSWTLAMGNAADMDSVADLLRKVDASVASDYQARTGKGLEQIAAWMDEETWFTADEAVEHGFADTVFDAPAADAKWNLSAYEKAPKALAEPLVRDFDRETLERRLQMMERIAP